MASSNLRNNIGLGSVVPSASRGSVIEAAGWAKAWGRTIPDQGGRIIGEVVEDLWSVDSKGIAFPAGTLWVRQACVYTGGDANSKYDDDDQFWVAVPPTLPAGFTYNPRRNIPSCTIGIGSSFRISSDLATFEPSYTPSAPIRVPGGIYTPHSSTLNALGGTINYGPFNFGQRVGEQDIGFASTVFDSYLLPFHPGFRNVRIEVKWVDSYYLNPATDPVYLETTIDGSTFTSHKADATLTGDGFYTAEIDAGPTTYAAAGACRQFTHTTQVKASPFPGRGGIRTYLYLSPRVDIPMPWSTTSGNLHAPGGILSGGNIPGY